MTHRTTLPGLAEGDTADAVHASMMAHGGEIHAVLMAGKSPEEMMAAKNEMDARIRQLVEANN